MLPDDNGLNLLARFAEIDPELPVIFMTAHSSVDNAVQAMKAGAYDYVTKPLEIQAIIPRAEKALELTALRREMRRIGMDLKKRYGYASIVGVSPHMTQVLEMIKTVAQSEAETIMLLGESGVGKNLIAQSIHYNSKRANRPFMTVTCTALPEHLLESEMFGHEKGAFTDARHSKKGLCELTDGGSLFLDEIGDMPLGLQAKLLRFLEDRTFRRIGGTIDFQVDVRIIAATNKNLKEAMMAKEFREDLFYRLNVIEIGIPPMRERVEDVPLLAMHFIKHFNKKFHKNVLGLDPSVVDAMRAYLWPGNVREMRNMVERAMILTKNDYLLLEDFHQDLRTNTSPEAPSPECYRLPEDGINLEHHERDLIRQAIENAGGNQSKAANLLGISRNQLIYRLKKFGL
jgi:DNA-binding NtrC family response regulator